MNAYSFVALFAFVAAGNAGILVGPSAQIIQGPSSRTTLVGPDGSSISAIAPAGQIVYEKSVGVVAQTAPLVAAAPLALAHSAPSLVASTPLVSAPWVGSAPLVTAHSAPVVSSIVGHSAVDTLVAGTIATSRNVAAPIVVAAPLVSAW